MQRTHLFMLILVVAAASASAQEIHVDYDRWARFTTFQTIAWAPSEETSMMDTSPMMHEHIKEIIMAQMTAGRLKAVEEDPDLYVTYHTAEKAAIRVDTHYWGYGLPSTWSWDPYWDRTWGAGMATTTVREYTQGTLIVDVWNAREKTLVWRGTAIGVVSPKPEKNLKKIEKAVKKMAKKWMKMKPGL